MASTRLAEAVGYPGSSVAFAQLLSGMERDGLISREVRGKRTYRIALSAPSATRRAGRAGGPQPVSSGPAGTGPLSTGPVSTGPVSSGPVGTVPVSTGPLSAGSLSAGPLGSGPVSAGPLGTGPVTAEEAALPAVPVAFPSPVDYEELADQVIVRLLRRIADLNPAELATLERLLVPGRGRPEELKIV
jgi:hypothetical protein